MAVTLLVVLVEDSPALREEVAAAAAPVPVEYVDRKAAFTAGVWLEAARAAEDGGFQPDGLVAVMLDDLRETAAGLGAQEPWVVRLAFTARARLALKMRTDAMSQANVAALAAALGV